MSFRVFNLTLLLFKYKLSQSCKQWQSRQLPRLGEAFGTSLLPQSHLSPASKSAAWGRTIYKTPKLSFKVEEPKLRRSLHSVLHSPQCRSHSASDVGFGDTSQLCTRASPLVAQHSSSGTESSQGWHGRHGVAAAAAGHSRGHFFFGRGSNHTQTVEQHREEAEVGGVSEGGRAGSDAAAALGQERAGRRLLQQR